MYVVIIRVTIHGLVCILFRIEKMIDLRFFKCTDIIISDALLIGDVEHFVDGMPLYVSCGSNGIS